MLVDPPSPESPVLVEVVVLVMPTVDAMSARMTISPLLSPELISVVSVPLAPILTVTGTDWPFFRTSTEYVVPVRWSADVGTISTDDAVLAVTVILAEVPLSNVAVLSDTATVTLYEGDVDVDTFISPIELTVPASCFDEPTTEIATGCCTFSLETFVTVAVEFTT